MTEPSTPPQPNPVPPQQPVAPTGHAAPVPPAEDTRPKALARTALIVALVGFALVLVGFLPLPGIGFFTALFGGIVLMVALVLAIIVLAMKKQGGKGLGIAALIVSFVGGIVAVLALFVAFAFAVVPATPVSGPVPVATPPAAETEAPAPGTGDTPTSADEAAYLEVVKPQLLAIVQEISPNFTIDSLPYPDEQLVQMGMDIGGAPVDTRPAQKTEFVDFVVFDSDNQVSEESAGALYDAIAAAADEHLFG